jgi:hypothetical protein
LIVVATVTGKITALTADSSFVFSHYDSSIDTTLFDRRPLLTSRGTFYVTTPGGEVLIDGHMVRASVSNIPQLLLRTVLVRVRFAVITRLARMVASGLRTT